ncbi:MULTISPECIES: hypothetical protein [Microvirga]|uniref:hypothetical protein n=1 Tax=Microvirga TaxID=186650 RepID=UPI001CFFB2FF|nr:hypothetical protein [Microvirga lenta]MCB5175840.1 hypothetical protein [Microvirga lenta]
MTKLKLLAATPLLVIGLAACGEDQVAQQPAEPTTAEAPVATTDTTTTAAPATTTAPPPTEVTAAEPNAAPPATMTMPPANATAPSETPSETTGAVGGENAALQRYQGRPYTSGAISLTLNPGGNFEMTQNQGSGQVSGQYSMANGVVTFQNPTGDVSGASFPMRCRLVESGEGFTLESVENSCQTLDGQTFRPAS